MSHVSIYPRLNVRSSRRPALWWQARCDAVGREVPRDLLLAALDLALTTYRSTVRAELEEACRDAQNAAHQSWPRH